MGDDIDDYDFINTNIISNEDDDEYDNEYDNDQDNVDIDIDDNIDDVDDDDAVLKRAEEKKLKKKRKLQEAKEKKKQKLTNTNSTTTTTSINIDDMNSLYQDNKSHNATSTSINITNFYDTNTNDKFKCSYVKAIAVGLGIDTYKATLLKESDEYGQPLVLIITANTQRATDLCKSLPQGLGLNKIKISKLFSKHLKVSEQMESLAKTHYAIAIGTPNRISKLVSLGSLQLSMIKLVIIDIEPDIKKFTILTMPTVKDDFYELMNHFDSSSSLSSLKITMINKS